LIKLKTEL